MKIVADALIPYVQEYFGRYGDLCLKPGRTITNEDVKDADILLIRSVTRVDAHLLKNSKVKFVGSVTAGSDHLDINWLNHSNLVFSVAQGFNAPPVADYVVSTIAGLKQEGLLKPKARAAVIGVGNVGKLVVKRLSALGFELILCDPLRASSEKHFRSQDLQNLEDVDVISLHVPLTRSGLHPTYHLIDKIFLQRQKKDCVLINTCRGSVINSQDLLRYGKHLYWCFDVWENEPKINKLILEKALIATPHIAGYSLQSKIRGVEMIYRIACEKNMVVPQPIAPLRMPSQQLVFADHDQKWTDVVLGVFNPLVITEMMKTVLLDFEDDGFLFDEMRNQFNSRYEFQYTQIKDGGINVDEQTFLKALGLKMTLK